MAIIAPQTAPNWAPGRYFRINNAQILCSPEEPVERWHIQVGFYASREARDDPVAGRNPIWTYHIFKPLADLPVDPREGGSTGLYAIVMADPLFAGTNAAADVAAADAEGPPGGAGADPGPAVDPQRLIRPDSPNTINQSQLLQPPASAGFLFSELATE